MSDKIKCEWCHGTGKIPCGICDGEGKVTCPECEGNGSIFSICPDCHEGRVLDPRGAEDDDTMPCLTCHGNYKTENGKCKTCGGTGKSECKACEGSGKVDCDLCDGKGELVADAFFARYLRGDKANLTVSWDGEEMSRRVFLQLEKIANAGLPEACYIVGCCYDRRCAVAERYDTDDESDSEEMSEGAASGGMTGIDEIVQEDLSKAERYFRICAESGIAAAQQRLAVLLLDDDKNDAQKREGVDLLVKAAENNCTAAIDALAFFHVVGVLGLEQSPQKALEYFKRHLERVNSDYMCNIVSPYVHNLLQAENGDVSAMLALVDAHNKVSLGGIIDKYCPNLELYWLEKAAASGNVEAVRKLADKKKYENLREAIDILSRSSDENAKKDLAAIMQECTKKQSKFDELKEIGMAGNVMVMKFIAKMYKEGVAGKNTEIRLSQSAKWLQMAAEAGDVDSKLDLAVRYRDGKGCPKDINKAFVLIYEGFEAGRKKRALRLFGEMYRWGNFAKPDHKKANELYAMSANAGYAASICCIGESYRDGLGVSKNEGEAKRLFELAVKKGSKDAAVALKKIPANVKPCTKPISGVTATGKSVKGPLPSFVDSDYEKAKEEKLWRSKPDQTTKTGKAKATKDKVSGQKKRWKFVLIGLFFGLLGLHFLYARRKGWFMFYWLMIVANLAQAKIAVVKELLAGFSPALATSPIFSLIAAVVLIGSIFFMKKDGNGNRM